MAAGLIAGVLGLLVKGASEALRQRERNNSPGRPLEIKPVSALRQGRKLVLSGNNDLSQEDQLKVATLHAITDKNYLVENKTVVEEKLKDLIRSSGIEAARAASGELFDELESEHQKVFVKSLALACSNASLAAGFPQISTSTTSLGTIRVIARDKNDRALVTEIKATQSDSPRIITETIGFEGTACKESIEKFDRSLEAQGVKSSPPKRSYTGGVCETTAALEFIKRKVPREIIADQSHESDRNRKIPQQAKNAARGGN